MPRALPVVLVLSVLSFAFAVPAQAVLITVSFSVTGSTSDPVNNGVTANGTFSFDSSIIPAGGGSVSSPATSGLDFTWDGTTWDNSNAVVSELKFDPSGNLVDWVLYGLPGGLFFPTSSTDPDDFFIKPTQTLQEFLYHNQGTQGSYAGPAFNVTYSVSTGSAPEPASWLLLGGALVGLVGVRRRIGK